MRYDVFCKIVDNFGDAAVCWRLAWQLANEHGHKVRLWIDLPNALGVLRPDLDRAAPRQMLDVVEIIHWSSQIGFDDPGDVVIEGFGCGLPEKYVNSMVTRGKPPLWIVLEYLSAESWIAGHHGLPSPHPRFELQRHFFFPGFTADSGGLIREAGLNERRRKYHVGDGARQALWAELGFDAPDKAVQVASLFGYDNPNVVPLLTAMANGNTEIIVLLPPSRLRPLVDDFLGKGRHPDGSRIRRGPLEIRFIRFLPQPRYDELLWLSDWNFVRGEDSFVRAQWAARPFVWQPYPQANRVHIDKLDAFLNLYCANLDADVSNALSGLWRSWNGSGDLLAGFWHRVQSHSDALRGHAEKWEGQMSAMPDLATKLANFCAERLK